MHPPQPWPFPLKFHEPWHTHGSPRKFRGHCRGPPTKRQTLCIPAFFEPFVLFGSEAHAHAATLAMCKRLQPALEKLKVGPQRTTLPMTKRTQQTIQREMIAVLVEFRESPPRSFGKHISRTMVPESEHVFRGRCHDMRIHRAGVIVKLALCYTCFPRHEK